MIEIITALIKTKFGFFQVQIESMFGHTIELSQTSFSETPERLDTESPRELRRLIGQSKPVCFLDISSC
jgi:hypothetical protein